MKKVFIILAILLYAWGCHKAFGTVTLDTTNGNTLVGTGSSVAVNLTCSSGDAVLLYISCTTLSSTFSVSGGTGCSWNQIATESTTGIDTFVFAAYNVSANSAQPITVTIGTGTSIISVLLDAYKGAASSSAFTTASAIITVQTSFTVSVTTASANSLVLAYASSSGNSTWSAGSGYTLSTTESSGTFSEKAAGEYANSVTAGSGSNVSPILTFSSSGTGCVTAVALAPLATGNSINILLPVLGAG